MNIRKLNNNLFVADQLLLRDLNDLSQYGINSIICNRPDDEGEEHLSSDFAGKKSLELNLNFKYLPVNSANITEKDVENQRQAIKDLPLPILMYCKSGTRCATLWALTEANGQNNDKLIKNIEETGLNSNHVKYYINR